MRSFQCILLLHLTSSLYLLCLNSRGCSHNAPEDSLPFLMGSAWVFKRPALICFWLVGFVWLHSLRLAKVVNSRSCSCNNLFGCVRAVAHSDLFTPTSPFFLLLLLGVAHPLVTFFAARVSRGYTAGSMHRVSSSCDCLPRPFYPFLYPTWASSILVPCLSWTSSFSAVSAKKF